MPDSKEKGLENNTIGLMISTAIFFDAFQGLMTLVPLLGWMFAPLVGFFAFMTFYLWFKLHGIHFASNPKRALGMGGSLIIEAIPGLSNIIPTWTLAVSILALSNRKKSV